MTTGQDDVTAALAELRAQPIDAFLAALASAEPVPGGGGAGALAGALAAALIAMVCRVTGRREAVPELEALAADADRLRDRLMTLVAEDGLAYANVIAARRLPAPEREAAYSAALRCATDVPLALAAVGRDALALGERIAGRARPSTRSDLHVAAVLARAALEAGAVTAQANLPDVADRAFTEAGRRAVDDLRAEGDALVRRIEQAIGERHTPTA